MITRIKVDGFKSLSDFSLSLTSGLNILVGPNGSGKTNIVSFFELLANLMEADASEAISRAGGVGAVFRKVGETFEREIRVELFGCVSTVRRGQKTSKAQPPFMEYEYGFKLIFPQTSDSVLLSSQYLRARLAAEFLDPGAEPSRDVRWGLEITSEPDQSGNPSALLKAFDEEFVDFPMPPGATISDAANQFSRFINAGLSDNLSLVSIMRRFSPNLSVIANDLNSGRVYNIVPTRIKLPEDSARPAGIGRDGSGLAATLYAIQRQKEIHHDHALFWYGPRTPRKIGRVSLDHLKAFLKVVNSAIDDIRVWNDPFDNQLRVAFDLQSGSYKGSVPLALMSDGTLKWVTLVTAALTATSVFSIEEPENYLHPQMQTRLVEILREILFRDTAYRMTLMTTHSETLLNHCRPEELIITAMENGQTKAVRCDNPKDIAAEIQRTGFGLGYYYIAGELARA